MSDDFDYESPEAIEHFERIWRGEAEGFSEAKIAASLAEHEKDLTDLNAGRIPPRRIVGTGYKNPRKVAMQWLTEQIEKDRQALATRGRSDTVNRGNVRFQLSSEECVLCGERHYRAGMKHDGNGWTCTDTERCAAYVAHRARYPKAG